MQGYQAKSDRPASGGAEQRSEAHVAARAGAQAEPAHGTSGKSAALLQLRHALDQSPKVQAQVALQRALDQRGAAGGHAVPKRELPEKPALQPKGIAIDDDAEAECTADAMEVRAGTAPANRVGAWAPVQRARKPTPIVGHKQGPLKNLYEPIIERHTHRVAGRIELKPNRTLEQLRHIINALENAIQLRKQVGALHGGSDSGHAYWIGHEENLLEEAKTAKLTAPSEADLIDKKASAPAAAPTKKLSAKQQSDRDKKKAKRAAKKADAKSNTSSSVGGSSSSSTSTAGAGGGSQTADKKDEKSAGAAPSHAGGGPAGGGAGAGGGAAANNPVNPWGSDNPFGDHDWYKK